MKDKKEFNKEYNTPSKKKLIISFNNDGSYKDFWYALRHDNGATLIDVLRECDIEIKELKGGNNKNE